jgi:hypothetical protein
LRCVSTDGDNVELLVPAQTSYVAGFAWKRIVEGASMSNDNRIIFAFKDTASYYHVEIRRHTNHSVQVYTANTYRGTLIDLAPEGVWYYFEIKATINDSTGSVVVKVNGVEKLNVTSIDTRATSAAAEINRIQLGATDGGYGSTPQAFDDFYLCDTTGTANNDFLGDVRVQSIFPSGAGATTQWTPSAGSNYQCVDDTAPNSDTDYVSETSAGDKDTYAFGNVTPTSGTVKGVQIMAYHRKDDAGSRSIAPVYRPTSTDYDGTTVSVLDSYTYLREVSEINPDGTSAWTISDVNGAEFGIKLVS